LLAVRQKRVLWIDAKAGQRTDTPNYDIETASLLAHRALSRIGFEVVIVWHDFRWIEAG
jgi:hypothetical protein